MSALVMTSVCERPNVCFVIFDDLRVNSSGLPLHMPELASVARDGVTFALAFASYPVCAPSRSMDDDARGPRIRGKNQF